jgi:5-deoxy-glucuronate isomerase
MSTASGRWFLPYGGSRRDGCEVVVDDTLDGWQHTGLRIVALEADQTWSADATDEWEHVVVPLSGGVLVEATTGDGARHEATLQGRASVFAGPTDVAYVPAGSSLRLVGRPAQVEPTSALVEVPEPPGARTSKPGDLARGPDHGFEASASASAPRPAEAGPAPRPAAVRVAVCSAKVTGPGTATSFRHVHADDVPVELRGAGSCSREVRNFGVPAVLDADSIIACEVLTPAGNWSSYPPHKHDEEREGVETELEEIYYFEVQPAGPVPPSADPVGYQRVYGTEERPIDVFAEVRSGDVVLVPHGWHGPSMAAPGYDLYYLNVMAGPGTSRAWLICDDPSHGWVRGTWEGMAVDPRLPFGGGTTDGPTDGPTGKER